MKYLFFIISMMSLLPLSLSAAPAANDIDTLHPVARATPPGIKNSGIFLTLKNNSDTAHTLIKAHAVVAGATELHTHIKEDGMMKMIPIDKIDIPANADTHLQPGGLHIMLINLKQDLKPGAEIELSLTFEDESTKTLVVPVKKVTPPKGPGHQKHSTM